MPFRSRGLVRRVTPFIGAGLVALVVFADPSFTHLPWADALAVATAAAATAAALSPVDWDRLPRLTMALPLVIGLLLGLGSTFTQDSLIPIAAAAAGAAVIIAIYLVPWDRFPRWVHNLPVFGGISAVFIIQATIHAPGFVLPTELLVLPLYFTTVLFAALYHTRNELLAAAALAGIAIMAAAVGEGERAGEPAISVLAVAVLWLVVFTVHTAVRRGQGAEERLRLLIDSISDYAIITLDPTGKVTTWSPGGEQIHGYRTEEIIGRNFSSFYPEEDIRAGKPDRELAEAAGVGRVEEEGWRVRKDGSRFWANVVTSALRGDNRGLRGFGQVTRDVSERKRGEDAVKRLTDELVQLVVEKTATNSELAEQKRLVESLLQNLSDLGMGLVISTGSKIQSVNDAFSRITGYGGGEGQRLPELQDLIAPEYMEQFRHQLAERTAGIGGVIMQEWEIVAADGHRVPVESISRSEVVDGRQHSVAIVLDITARKQAAQALAQSQARLQAIIDTSLTAIVTMDEHGAITDWNPQAEETFGWSRDEVLGKILADTIIPEQYRVSHRVGLAHYLATGEGPVLGKVLELSALNRDGREFPVELAISPASAPGGNALFVGFLRDITDRKKSEDAIKRLNSELQIASRHKSEFLANMSHELRTPLNAILGFSELMIDDTTGRYDVGKRQKFLSQVSSSGRHLLGLINDILDLSKVEAGQMELSVETVSVSEMVAQVMDTIEPIAAKKKIRVSADVAGGGQLDADPSKLKQMLLNLVSNAVKFTPEGGSVSIGAQRLHEMLEISVADNGIGIAESDLGRLFTEFQQLDPGAARKQEGTGLGLALTKRLAALHGGDVRVASDLGKGSTFTLVLPLRRGAPLGPNGRTPGGA